ncbi:MAG: DUF2330 domain-containing protein [Armatimonadetes bacterium]|nr:DUF2330 domain-containing protein [Armatimonadota bacterium]
MKSLLAVVIFVCAFASIAWSDGCMMVDEATWKVHRERALINEPEQKAVVFFSKGTEDLIISPSYEGPTNNFAWVIPVPAKPRVQILKGAIFHELAALTMPKPMIHKSSKKIRITAAVDGHVTVIERKTVGAYDVSVLATSDGQALVKWLKTNKYHLPKNAVKPIESYVKKGWVFVACRIKVPGNAKGLRTGTLAPIRLTFKADNPVYPMKLSAANPKPFKVLVYVITPSNELADNFTMMALISSPHRNSPRPTYLRAQLNQRQTNYPTLAKLTNANAKIFVQSGYFRPTDCDSDFVWSLMYK